MRTALGALLIQKQLGFLDRELVEEITENPYLQYFIGLPGYQAVPPFVPSLLVEFGAKLDRSLDEDGMAHIEKLSFDAYNESDALITAVQRYFGRNGHYPERVLADKTYRNRANLGFCKDHGIRLSSPSLGRPRKNSGTDKKTEYMDNADRVVAERAFALAKSKHGLGLITSKLDQTTRSSIVLSVVSMNVDRIYRSRLSLIFDIVLSRYTQHEFMLKLI